MRIISVDANMEWRMAWYVCTPLERIEFQIQGFPQMPSLTLFSYLIIPSLRTSSFNAT